MFILNKKINLNTTRIWSILLITLSVIPLLAYYIRIDLQNNPRLVKMGENHYIVSNDIYSASLSLTRNDLPKMEFSLPESERKVSFTLDMEGEYSLSRDRGKNKAIYKVKDFESVSIEYSTLANGVKEEIIVEEPPRNWIIPFTLETKDVELKDNLKDNMLPIFLDNENNYLFHLEQPFAVDSNGNKSNNFSYRIKRVDNDKYKVLLTLDQEWLRDKSRRYPVIIDPTIIHDTTAEFSTGQFNRSIDTGSGASPSIESFYQELAADEYTIGLWHMNEGSDNSCSGGEDLCDSSKYSTNGTFGGNTAFSSSSKLGSYAIYFDGTDDYATLGDVDKMDTASQFTFSTWFKRTTDMNVNSSHNIQNILLAQASNGSNDNLEIGTNGSTIDIYIDTTGGANTLSVEAGIQNNRWYHLAVVFDSTTSQTLQIYLDGEHLTSWSTPTGSLDTSATSPLSFGISRAGTDNNGDYNGYMDETLISLKPFTPEKIKSVASRRPSSVYTSEVIDLTTVAQWNSLSWTESGVGTGDGETLKDSTSLIAQWNFNETSGATATNNAGACGTSCNGTLTSFSNTTSQDIVASSGWTANNRRWGSGALMFNGSSNYVNAGSDSSLKFNISSSFSIGGWIYVTPGTTNRVIAGNGWTTAGYHLRLTTTNQLRFIVIHDNTNYKYTDSPTALTTGWHYVVGMWDGSATSLYVDGVQIGSQVTTGTVTNITSVNNFHIGNISGQSVYFSGVIDSLQVFARVLTPSEILSNYNSSNIELQTRVGSNITPDDGSWEEWRPVTNETSLENYNSPYLYDSTHANLISYWPLDETTNDSCSGGEDVCDPVSSNHGTDTGGSKIIDGKFSKARSFDGSDDRINIYSSGLASAFDPTQGTVALWMKIPDASIWSDSSNDYAFIIAADSTSNLIRIYRNLNEITVNYAAGGTYEGQDIVYSGTDWVHVAMTWDKPNDEVKVYFNGKQYGGISSTLGTWSGSIASNRANIGTRVDSTDPFKGYIDEVLLYDTPLTADEIYKLAQKGSTGAEGLQTSNASIIKTEGNYAQKITNNTSIIDTYTVGLWHLDETGGSGAYIKDSSGNSNHGTPTGTTVLEGIANKARNFNGTSDYIELGDTTILDGATQGTIAVWVKPRSIPTGTDHNSILAKADYTAGGNSFFIRLRETEGVRFAVRDSSGNQLTCDTLTFPEVGVWTHITGVFTTSDACYVYYNGVQKITNTNTSFTSVQDTTTTLKFGSSDYSSELYFDGAIDEVTISNKAQTASEIAEYYRLGRDHYINQTVSSTDLSSKTSLPFYIAADRPGTYLQSTIGESAYVNGQPDTNTVGLWRLEEQSGSGDYLKDSSGNSNHGTPTGTTFTQGQIGKARTFNGSSDYLTVTDTNALDSVGQITIEAWVKTLGSNDYSGIVYKNAGLNGYQMSLHTGGGVRADFYNGSTYTTPFSSNVNVEDGKWHYVVASYDGSNSKIYVDGMLSGTVASGTGFVTASTANLLIGNDSSSASRYFNGQIDEVRISNVARSAEEIRASYEYGLGLRSHQITIDFGASLDSGNLISGSGDFSFTVDATTYGLNQKGSMLFSGDKIIVRENYDGTEYIAQGTVTSITASTGSTTIATWDPGSTFPSGGYTANASIFKWQKEYWPIGNNTLASHMDTITNLSLRVTDSSEGRTIWLDDLKSSGGYLTTPSGSTITSSTGHRYLQYRSIFTNMDSDISASLSNVALDYTENVPPDVPTLSTPNDTATSVSLTPQFKTITNDYNNDYVRYKIEICENIDMATNCQTFDQTTSQTGWSGQNADSGTAYTTGVSDWYDQDWGYRMKITLDSSQITADLTDFPIYINLADLPSDFHTNVNQTDARDIRITKGDGTTELPREVVFYNSTNDTGEIHIQYTGTLSSTVDSDIYVYYGNPSASDYGPTDTYGRNNVWDENYIGVYHLSESSGQHYSSTGTHDSTSVAVTQQGANIGKLYTADEFANSNDISFADNDAYSVNTTNQFTAEAWVYLDSLATRTEPLNKGSSNNYEWGVRIETNGSLRGEIYTPTGASYLTAVTLGSQITTATWYHLALSTNISTPRTDIFRNGVSLANATTPSGSYGNGTAAMRIGERADGGNDTDGIIDEVRFSNIARSADWLLTQYNNQSNPSTFYTYTSQELVSNGVIATYTLQSPLESNSTYYWRSYAIDYDGSNTWSYTQNTPYSFTTNAPPNSPTLNAPINEATNQIILPQLQLTSTDPDSDSLQYKVVLCTNLELSENCQTFDQTNSQTGWSGHNAIGNTAYTSGTQATYTILSQLDSATTYYWKGYAKDVDGTNLWSTQSTVSNFTTSSPPSSPTNLKTEGQTNPSNINTLAPQFTAVHTDPDGDSATYYEIEVNTSSDFTGTVMWDSGLTSITTIPSGNTSPSITYAGNTLTINNIQYFWRIRFQDDKGVTGEWSTTAFFRTSPINITQKCYIIKAHDNSYITIYWSASTGEIDDYILERSVNGGSYSTLTTLPNTSLNHQDSNVSNGNTYQYRVGARYNGVTGNLCTTSVTNLQTGSFIIY